MGGDSSALNDAGARTLSVRKGNRGPAALTHYLLEMETVKVNKKPVRLIAARCDGGGLAKANQMPWSLP